MGTKSLPRHQLTLITGDRVSVDAKGRVVGFRPTKDREQIPVQRHVRNGHTYIIPTDAHRLIGSGKLDRRFFDVTFLNRPEIRRSQQKGLRLIVGYRGAQTDAAKAGVRDTGDTSVGRTLKSLNAESVITPRSDAEDIWQALTVKQSRSVERTTAPGIDRVWLDGVRRASLDRSVPQIGAPAAWKAGYTGKGVKIAVLDTGVDATHPDLKGQILATKNFSTSADTKDRVGHGTHVSSIAAGTGAKSGGKFKGVAPDAKLLEGKVLDDDGYGTDSGIVAGMEWAAAQGADIVNLSLGGLDQPGIDPLEATVNKLSAETGVLFAIAAGNEGDGSRHGQLPGQCGRRTDRRRRRRQRQAGRLLQPWSAHRRLSDQARCHRPRRGHHGGRGTGLAHRPGSRPEAVATPPSPVRRWRPLMSRAPRRYSSSSTRSGGAQS